MQSRLGIFLLLGACVIGNVAGQKPTETVTDQQVVGYESLAEVGVVEEHSSLAGVGSSSSAPKLPPGRRRRRASLSRHPGQGVPRRRIAPGARGRRRFTLPISTRVARLEASLRSQSSRLNTANSIIAKLVKELKALRADMEELKPAPPASTPPPTPDRRRRLRSPKDEACTGKKLNESCKYSWGGQWRKGYCQVEDEDDPLACLPEPSPTTPPAPGSRRRRTWNKDKACSGKKLNAFCWYEPADFGVGCGGQGEKGCALKPGYCQVHEGPPQENPFTCLPGSPTPATTQTTTTTTPKWGPPILKEEACKGKKLNEFCWYGIPNGAREHGWCQRTKDNDNDFSCLPTQPTQAPGSRRRGATPKVEACTGKKEKDACGYTPPGAERKSGWCLVQDEDDPLACLPGPKPEDPKPMRPDIEACQGKKVEDACSFAPPMETLLKGGYCKWATGGPICGDNSCMYCNAVPGWAPPTTQTTTTTQTTSPKWGPPILKEEACKGKKLNEFCWWGHLESAHKYGWCRRTKDDDDDFSCLLTQPTPAPGSRRRGATPKVEACTGKKEKDACGYTTPGAERKSGWCLVQDEDDPLACLPGPKPEDPKPMRPDIEACQGKKVEDACFFAPPMETLLKGGYCKWATGGPICGDNSCMYCNAVPGWVPPTTQTTTLPFRPE